MKKIFGILLMYFLLVGCQAVTINSTGTNNETIKKETGGNQGY